MKQNRVNNNSLWQHFPTLSLFWKYWHLYVKIIKGNYCGFIAKYMGHLICLWEERRVWKHIIFFILLSKTSVNPKLSLCLIKTFTYTLQMKLISDHKFTEGTEIRQAATSSQPMRTAVYHRLPPVRPTNPTLIRFQAPVAFFYSADERDCLGLALMNWHYY